MKQRELDWSISATCGMLGNDLDEDFLKGLSVTELLNLNLNAINVLSMIEQEVKSRGI